MVWHDTADMAGMGGEGRGAFGSGTAGQASRDLAWNGWVSGGWLSRGAAVEAGSGRTRPGTMWTDRA